MSGAMTSADRKRHLEQELARFIAVLVDQGDPEQVIVFGSLAKGEVHAWSDIDLVVVEQTELPFLR